MSRSKLMFGLLTAGLVAFSVPASAGQSGNPPVASVSYADLDLTTSAGLAALNRRIEAAASRVCESQRTGPAPWNATAVRRCMTNTLANARPQIEQAAAQANGVELAGRTPILVRDR